MLHRNFIIINTIREMRGWRTNQDTKEEEPGSILGFQAEPVGLIPLTAQLTPTDTTC